MPGDGKCIECGAYVRGGNCSPPINPCTWCGQCDCLRRDNNE